MRARPTPSSRLCDDRRRAGRQAFADARLFGIAARHVHADVCPTCRIRRAFADIRAFLERGDVGADGRSTVRLQEAAAFVAVVAKCPLWRAERVVRRAGVGYTEAFRIAGIGVQTALGCAIAFAEEVVGWATAETVVAQAVAALTEWFLAATNLAADLCARAGAGPVHTFLWWDAGRIAGCRDALPVFADQAVPALRAVRLLALALAFLFLAAGLAFFLLFFFASASSASAAARAPPILAAPSRLTMLLRDDGVMNERARESKRSASIGTSSSSTRRIGYGVLSPLYTSKPPLSMVSRRKSGNRNGSIGSWRTGRDAPSQIGDFVRWRPG
jgi:hypothetical protein